ncbi:hypothetical protein VIMY103929_11425 [Vibrio mytili]
MQAQTQRIFLLKPNSGYDNNHTGSEHEIPIHQGLLWTHWH